MTVPRKEFQTEIENQIRLGGELLERTEAIQSDADHDAVRSDYYTWNDYNKELLRRRFTTSEIAEEYSHIGPFVVGGHYGLGEKINDLRDDIQGSIRRLVSIKGRVALIPEAATVRPHDQPPQHHGSDPMRQSRSSSSTATTRRSSSPFRGSFVT